MTREFMELSLYVQKVIAAGVMMLATTCMFLWFYVRLYNFVSRYTKNNLIKIFVVLFVGTNIFALFMMLARMIGVPLAS